MRSLLQSAYILHARPFRDTSLILDIFARQHGRLSILAKGARQAKRRAVVFEPFQCLELSWAGRGELPVLAQVETTYSCRLIGKVSMYSGLYLNELLVHLLHKHDPHEALFDDYDQCVRHLESPSIVLEGRLRFFEKRLLEELGYGLALLTTTDDTGREQLIAEHTYYYDCERGLIDMSFSGDTKLSMLPQISGRSVKALLEDDYNDINCLQEMKRLMRYVLNYHLAGKVLQTRTLFRRSDVDV
ncbi:MAG: DNA repair protein RecO [Gammaproteobacteria bacterium]|nr:DNA repair protein RecO [Gammaproteobacteria bacterium]